MALSRMTLFTSVFSVCSVTSVFSIQKPTRRGRPPESETDIDDLEEAVAGQGDGDGGGGPAGANQGDDAASQADDGENVVEAVSYTHLTLPTICSV